MVTLVVLCVALTALAGAATLAEGLALMLMWAFEKLKGNR